eukprot:TRINITY_DN17705_c0_g1_i10.p2 TRINITY_DN17705_c0_g1~~TRINITY_DN17705_c0_g1_i10.p2  ORF type:complete len:130 (+),score=0.58 TRINITY_DN17705_c0_g1_i10:1-390(+)
MGGRKRISAVLIEVFIVTTVNTCYNIIQAQSQSNLITNYKLKKLKNCSTRKNTHYHHISDFQFLQLSPITEQKTDSFLVFILMVLRQHREQQNSLCYPILFQPFALQLSAIPPTNSDPLLPIMQLRQTT